MLVLRVSWVPMLVLRWGRVTAARALEPYTQSGTVRW